VGNYTSSLHIEAKNDSGLVVDVRDIPVSVEVVKNLYLSHLPSVAGK
jgi:hypothetical protein